MRTAELIRRNLAYYRRTNAAVVVGVATAVAVLGGALLVGDSVRGSLRDLITRRLGRTDQAIVAATFFREALADDLRGAEGFAASFGDVAPLIAIDGVVGDQQSGRRVARVPVYGVDERFWRFHGATPAGGAAGGDRRQAFVSEALAADIGARPGGAVLVRVAKPSAVPLESLHGRKDNAGRTLRLTVRAVLDAAQMGEFSLRPQQRRVRAVFVPLAPLQQELELEGRVNTLLVSARGSGSGGRAALESIVRGRAALDDLGVTVRAVEATHEIAVESAAGLVDPVRAAAVERAAGGAGMMAESVFTYLATTLRSGSREIPYSLVAAVEPERIAGLAAAGGGRPPIVVNEWTARDLGARVGDPLTLDYDVWEEPGQLSPRSTEFRIAGVVPIEGLAADRTLAPVYPGITESATLADWDPPFPIDLRRVRPVDEAYWKQYRTTAKAFIPVAVGRQLWRSRYGDRTSMRLAAAQDRPLREVRDQFAAQLRAGLDPVGSGLSVQDVRADGLAASRGTTDFGEYFTYFSFFLVVSALLLAALFFRLGVEQRAREVGLLRAVGYTTARIRRLFAAEGLLVSALGCVLGVGGAIGYAWVMMAGLGSWWSGAVGTDALRLHVSAASLVGGAVGIAVAAMACLWWTLRGLEKLSERSLLAGLVTPPSFDRTRARGRMPLIAAIVLATGGLALMSASAAGAADRAGSFFGGGALLLAASLCSVSLVLRRPSRQTLEGRGWWPLCRLGLRHAGDRPSRSVLVVAVIAAATFILISVDAFRHTGVPETDRRSGVGGYSILVQLVTPLAHDPNGPEGREALGLAGSEGATIEPFRMRQGDDASCLNLYEPRNPTILGARAAFLDAGRFSFQAAVSGSDAERANPWLLLEQQIGDEGQSPVIPVIADANSMTYVLHKALGEDLVMDLNGRQARLRFVAALRDSVLQSQLVISESNFLRLFPNQPGYQMLLVETAAADVARVKGALDEGTRDSGAEVVSTGERLAEFHRVENTYISTFQTLGGLGLLVGTVGLAAVLLRNVLERRKELALLGAVGYRHGQVFAIVLAENVLLLLWGLAIGAICAVIAVAPALHERGGLPINAGGWLLLASVFAAGLLSSLLATRAALRTPLLAALRAE